MSHTNWEAVRRQFSVLRDWAYLNTATFGPVPQCALEAARQHSIRRDQGACLDFISWFDDADRVRKLAARLMGAQADDIAFAPNAGTALGWLIQGIDWKPGDRVVALADEFPNNTYFGHMLARRGAEFVEVALEAGEFSLDRFCAAIDGRTRLVLMSTVNYSTGLRPPVEAIGTFLRERGVLFYLDATQSLGALRFDVRAAQAGLVAAHGYKWLLAPAGIGLAYVSPEVREWLEPAVLSWRSHRNWRCVDDLHHGAPELPSSAQRYEGGLQNFHGIYALGAVLEMIFKLGLARIERRVCQLAETTRDVLRESGGELESDRLPHYDSPIVAARFPGVDVSQLAKRLARRRIAVAARHGLLRVSPHFFNNNEDLARLREGLQHATLTSADRKRRRPART